MELYQRYTNDHAGLKSGVTDWLNLRLNILPGLLQRRIKIRRYRLVEPTVQYFTGIASTPD
jgi:hypothetical protein